MDKFIGFFRNVTILLFTGALIWSYAFMASQVNYRFDPAGDALGTASKNTYFFGAIIVFLLANVVCSYFTRVLKKITTTEDGRGIRNRSLKKDLINWIKGFAGVLNLFFSLILVFLGLMNMSADYNIKTLGFYVYLGPVLILSWFFYLAVILGKRRS
ncbi:hypothetical protein [Roseivirga sp. E12]|uniref:hypothetical protein n=1 Tax=Roseivirga sp. E12 TaxID=2819237 RepID=UPI001ABD224A|nr:hypothetical protein [Roseivirga sp. E12]MBO3697075.1 hypothetical protein [Roseivirga sp. E12]